MKDLLIIKYCSPTLAGMKVGSIFGLKYNIITEIDDFLNHWNQVFKGRGLRVKVLSINEKRANIYLYRASMLEEILNNQSVREFLLSLGYKSTNPDYVLSKLSERIQEGVDFPHEIGVILGYPVEDIKGFMENCGKNYLCSGCWKVYNNVNQTKKLFEKYKKCKVTYMKNYGKGVNITRLAVVR